VDGVAAEPSRVEVEGDAARSAGRVGERDRDDAASHVCDAAVGVGFSGRREVGSTGGHWTDRQPERYPAHMKIRKKDITSQAKLSAIEQERKPSWPALYGPPEPSANSPANSLAT
ncbi:hypothetical protein ACWCO9_29750, partial [Streptomyces sp. NPDC001937]